jgi:hypothetical protein
MKLFVVGNKSPNPDDWSIWDEVKIVVAENDKRARELAGAHEIEPVAEIKLDKEQLLISQSEPNWCDDL